MSQSINQASYSTCNRCSCGGHHTPTPPAEMQPLVDLVKATNDATLAVSEVARVQAHAILAQIEREKTKPALAVAAPPEGAEAIPGILSRTEMVISERVGSISVKEWQGMSADRLMMLDQALRRIVATALVPNGEWKKTGSIIHRELATVGFKFKTLEECQPVNINRDWREAEDATLPDLVRMRAAANASKSDLGGHWWVDEMVRIVIRLMELRVM